VKGLNSNGSKRGLCVEEAMDFGLWWMKSECLFSGNFNSAPLEAVPGFVISSSALLQEELSASDDSESSMPEHSASG
jgi:hypothetical protein